MATVFVPPMLRPITNNSQTVEVSGPNLRAVLEELNAAYPGFEDRICIDGQLRPELSVWINDEIISRGLEEPIAADCEIHFLPALGGG
ncbi:MAG: MoaD/ThiS family protein [Planctomycetaceae bacterium]